MARTAGRKPPDDDDVDDAPDPIDIQVGERVRMRRLFLGINLQALAGRVGLTFQQVQKYENGSNRVSASRLQEIAKELGVGVGYFFEDIVETDASSPAETAWRARIREPDAIELTRYYYGIRDSRIREHFLELIKAAAAPDRAG